MLKRLRPQVAWSASLLLASLWLAACSGATESAPSTQEPTALAQTVEAAPTSETETDQGFISSEQEAPTETIATEVALASPTANSAAAPKAAICQAIDIPNNELAAAVSADDWSKGPDNAPVTLIEYGDFQ